MSSTTDTGAFDLVELCLDSQYHRGNLAPARGTWRDSFKIGFKGEAYHSGSFFTSDVKRYVNEQFEADLEKWKIAKAEYDNEVIKLVDSNPEEIKKLKEPKRPKPSLRGYKGEHWSPFFMLDIDTRRVGPKWELIVENGAHRWRRRTTEEGDAFLQENPTYREDTDAARVEALEVIRCLELLGVEPESLIICFSGNKGFHVYVPTSSFDPEPCDNFIYRIRWIVQNALVPKLNTEKVPYPEDSVDWQVFDRLKALRAVNSIHQSGYWKVPISYRALQSMSFDRIREMGKGPNLNYMHPDWRNTKKSAALQLLWNNPECVSFMKPTVHQVDAKAQPPAEGVQRRTRTFDVEGRVVFKADEILKLKGPVPNRPLCMIKLQNEDVGSGNRHQACLMLLATWWREGYSPEIAFTMAREWLSRQAGTRHDDDYLQQQIKSVWSDTFNWNCNHPLAMKNCFSQCRRYPEAKSGRDITLHTLEDSLEKLLEREGEEVLYFLPYEPFKSNVKLRPKQVVVFIAETATGKTAFWWDVCRVNSQGIDMLIEQGIVDRGGCGFISLEMPREELAERASQWITGSDQKFVSSILMEELDARDNGETTYRFGQLKEGMGKYYRRVRIIEEDKVDLKRLRKIIRQGKEELGIGLWVVDYMGRMSGHGANAHERLSQIARDMKTVAREEEAIIVVLVQVARSNAEKGKPNLRSGRGSGEIEESADIVITAYRPDRYEKDDSKEQPAAESKETKETGYQVEMTCEKQRGGSPHQKSVLWFDGASMRFTQYEEWKMKREEYVDHYTYLFGT